MTRHHASRKARERGVRFPSPACMWGPTQEPVHHHKQDNATYLFEFNRCGQRSGGRHPSGQVINVGARKGCAKVPTQRFVDMRRHTLCSLGELYISWTWPCIPFSVLGCRMSDSIKFHIYTWIWPRFYKLLSPYLMWNNQNSMAITGPFFSCSCSSPIDFYSGPWYHSDIYFWQHQWLFKMSIWCSIDCNPLPPAFTYPGI